MSDCGCTIPVLTELRCGYDLSAPFIDRIEIKEVDGKEVCTMFRPDGSALIDNANVKRLENGRIEVDTGKMVFEIIVRK